jgi:hypothetical protein
MRHALSSLVLSPRSRCLTRLALSSHLPSAETVFALVAFMVAAALAFLFSDLWVYTTGQVRHETEMAEERAKRGGMRGGRGSLLTRDGGA